VHSEFKSAVGCRPRSSGRARAGLFGGLLSALLIGCPPDGPPPLELEEGCNPLLAGYDCMLPYPSDHFLVSDASLPSGHRVQMPLSAALMDNEGYSADVTEWRPSDGFSRSAPIVAVLGVELSDAGLVGIFDDYADSAKATSRTLLIDADSGALVPHFVDLDGRATDPLRRAIVIRPMVPLDYETRYVVALQGLEQPAGKAAPAPEGFRRLRDAEVGEDPVLKPLLERYQRDLFPVLEQLGVDRAGLQLAWDFTTGSELHLVDDMLRTRELVLAELEVNPPTLESIGFVEDPDEHTWRRVIGIIDGPMVMERDSPGAVPARDAEGRVRLNGRARIPFTVIVPTGVRDGYDPGIVLEFGHGVFGSQDEVDALKTRRIFDRTGSVGFAIDWAGMSAIDIGIVIGAVGDDVWRSMQFSDRVLQAMANWLSMTAAIRGLFTQEPLLHRPEEPGLPGVVTDPANPGSDNAGALVYDPAHINFLGISQGAILGGVYSALNPAIERSILHVGGAGWTHIMSRAVPFARFLFIMDISMPDLLDQQKLIATMQMYFDRIDPATFAPFVLDRELPFGPPGNAAGRRILLQAGIADTSVPSFTCALHARHLGVPITDSSPLRPFGLETVTEPHEGSAVALFDLGVDDAFFAVSAPPDDETEVHEQLRRSDEAMTQMREFLHTGTVVNPCDGPCYIEPDPID